MDVNINSLFENNTFENIEIFKNNLNENANKKKDDLRQIIGQNYRDLIPISNVINRMSINCDNVITNLNELRNYCKNSKLTSIKKFDSTNQDVNLKSEKNITDIVLIKIIVNSSYLIIESLFEYKIILASLLYRRALFLYKKIKNSDKYNFLIQHNIFLEKLSDAIYEKYLSLIYYDEKNLLKNDLLKNFYAITFLKETSFDEVVIDFLDIRKKQSLKVFCNSNKLVDFFKIIFDTLENIFKLKNSVNFITKDSIVNKIECVNLNYNFLNKIESKTLKNLFKDFNVNSYIKDHKNLEEFFEKNILKWFSDLKNESNSIIENYLKNFTIDDLYLSFKEVKEYFDLKETLTIHNRYYELICKEKINFWDYLISEPFTLAWQYYLLKGIEELFENLKNKVNLILEEETKIFNFSDFNWSNDFNDGNKKTSGTNEKINELIYQTNFSFNNLVEKFLNRTKTNEIIFNQNFKSFFYSNFKNENDKFLIYIKRLTENENKKEAFFNLLHFIRMLALNCNNYKQCFDILSIKSWFDTKETLLNLSIQGYIKFINEIIKELVFNFEDNYNKSLINTILVISSEWSEIEIEELIDENKTVSTKIYVPKYISLPLENLLTNLAFKLTKIFGHTLPFKLKPFILKNLVTKLIETYTKIHENLLKVNDSVFKTKQYLQIYFDLSFVNNLIIHIDHEDNLKNDFQKIYSLFQNQIDPFDLHLFSPYIQNAISENNSFMKMYLHYLFV